MVLTPDETWVKIREDTPGKCEVSIKDGDGWHSFSDGLMDTPLACRWALALRSMVSEAQAAAVEEDRANRGADVEILTDAIQADHPLQQETEMDEPTAADVRVRPYLVAGHTWHKVEVFCSGEWYPAGDVWFAVEGAQQCESAIRSALDRMQRDQPCEALPPREPDMDETKVMRTINFNADGWTAAVYLASPTPIALMAPSKRQGKSSPLFTVEEARRAAVLLAAAAKEADASRHDWMLDLTEESCNQEAKAAVAVAEKGQATKPQPDPRLVEATALIRNVVEEYESLAGYLTLCRPLRDFLTKLETQAQRTGKPVPAPPPPPPNDTVRLP